MLTYSAICPSCGAPLVFHSATTLSVVCEYCKSTLVREADQLKNLGRMAELLEDHSPLQLGAEGRYRGLHFKVIGRIQLRYPGGVWNEWYILLNHGGCAWLSDAAGEMLLTFRLDPEKAGALPAFDDLTPGQPISLLGQAFAVGNQETAEVIAAAGELPKAVMSGYLAPVVDLRMRSAQEGPPDAAFVEALMKAAGQKEAGFMPPQTAMVAFATLDYSDLSPLVFIGEILPFASLEFTGLKEDMQQVCPVKAFLCPGCGAPLRAGNAEIRAVACSRCGTIVDSSHETLVVLSKAQKQIDTIKPGIPLGSHACFEGYDYELIGLIGQKMTSEGVVYRWREYLLYCPQQGFRWLTEYNGHWNFVTPLLGVPTFSSSSESALESLEWQGRVYRHFQSSTATVDYVLGEFYWQVKCGDECSVVDYIAPPYLLSSEKTEHELIWSQGVYLEPSVVRKAFALPSLVLPVRTGIGANQPSSYIENQKKMLGLCLGLIFLSFVIQIVLGLAYNNDSPLLEYQMHLVSEYPPVQGASTAAFVASEKEGSVSLPQLSGTTFVTDQASGTLSFLPLRTPSFDFGGGNLYVNTQIQERTKPGEAFPDNAWLALNLNLVNQKTGEQISSMRELYRASGRASDGAWSEEKKQDELFFKGLASGRYYFLVEPEYGSDALSTQGKHHSVPMIVSLGAQAAHIGWKNWGLFCAYILALLMFYFLRKEAVETKRWAESDHEK